jgi:UDP-N-acetyl-D-mannosaminuronate dehydrogenase
MAFKVNPDDNRSSLAYKLKRILKFKSGGVLTADPYVKNDTDLVEEEKFYRRATFSLFPHPIFVKRS